jgi:hypothetical protein
MSEDPKLFDAGDYNLFRYVHNDPLDLTDPMGLGDEAVNAQMVKVGYVNPAMHAQTILPIGSNIPVLAVRLANAQWVDYRAAGGAAGLTMGQVRRVDGHEIRRAAPVHNIGVFDPSVHRFRVFMKDGRILTYSAGNNASNPHGDPFKVGTNGPFPHGITWNVDHMERFSPADGQDWTDYGPAFFKIGDPGTIAYRRGTGLHAGTDSPFSLTNGCLRISNDSMRNFLGHLDATRQQLEQVYAYPLGN